MMEELFSLGEMIEKIKKGEYAISKDEGIQEGDTIISVDDDNWVFIIYPKTRHLRHNLNIMKSDDSEHLRVWEIRKNDDYFKKILDESILID